MDSLPRKESLTVEFKSDMNCLPDHDIIDVVVAFANTEGGDLYLGVEDDGTVTGLHARHRDITRLTAFIANKTVPPVSTHASILHVGTQEVLRISVPRYSSIVASAAGKIQRRRLKADHTPENVPLYPYEIPQRLSSLSLLDFSAQPLPDASRDDFSAAERERLQYLRTVFPSLLITGPFSIVFGFDGGIMALNDRLKLRSIVVGEKADKVFIASEEAAIRTMEPDAENIWAPAGGEPVIIKVKDGAV